MAGITQARANAMLDTELSGTLNLRLFTVAPTPTTAGTEVSGSGYGPQTIAFSAASGGVKVQSGAVTFPAATSNYSAPVVAWAITDGTGNQKFFLAFTPITVNSGDQISFPTGTIQVSLS
jgi:hypothetical protein